MTIKDVLDLMMLPFDSCTTFEFKIKWQPWIVSVRFDLIGEIKGEKKRLLQCEATLPTQEL